MSGGLVLHFLAFIGSDEGCEWVLKNGAYPHCTNSVNFPAIFIIITIH